MAKQKETEYLEIDLDSKTMADVETLAEKSKVAPFEMGVILLREALASYEQPTLRE